MQIKNLVLKDGQATPADHTFTPQTSQKGTAPAEWLERNSGSPIGYNRVTALVSASQSGVSKVSLVIATPKLQSLGAGCCVDQNTPQVSFTEFANIVFKLPASSTIQDRKDILALAKNLLASDQVVAMVENLEPAY